MAKAYSENNKQQQETGKTLVALLGIKSGEKVLDMGCGTGEITAFIADHAGENGHVVGVDPDKDRIEMAIEKHSNEKRTGNITFIVGDSSSNFPHFNEEYYDITFSNFVFHWLSDNDKTIFVEAAMKCLKPGGKLAMYTQDRYAEIIRAVLELFPDHEYENRNIIPVAKKSLTESILKDTGFEILASEYVNYEFVFPDVNSYLNWQCACGDLDTSRILRDKKKAFVQRFAQKDGTVYFKDVIYRVIAKKPFIFS